MAAFHQIIGRESRRSHGPHNPRTPPVLPQNVAGLCGPFCPPVAAICLPPCEVAAKRRGCQHGLPSCGTSFCQIMWRPLRPPAASTRPTRGGASGHLLWSPLGPPHGGPPSAASGASACVPLEFPGACGAAQSEVAPLQKRLIERCSIIRRPAGLSTIFFSGAETERVRKRGFVWGAHRATPLLGVCSGLDVVGE